MSACARSTRAHVFFVICKRVCTCGCVVCASVERKCSGVNTSMLVSYGCDLNFKYVGLRLYAGAGLMMIIIITSPVLLPAAMTMVSIVDSCL